MKPGDVFRVDTFEGRQFVATVFVSDEVTAEHEDMIGRAVRTAIERAKEKAHAD
jgi:hypothetical protein